MNKLLAFLMLLSLSLGTNTFAQEGTQAEEESNTADSIVADSSTKNSTTELINSATSTSTNEPVAIKKSFTEVIKDKFI